MSFCAESQSLELWRTEMLKITKLVKEALDMKIMAIDGLNERHMLTGTSAQFNIFCPSLTVQLARRDQHPEPWRRDVDMQYSRQDGDRIDYLQSSTHPRWQTEENPHFSSQSQAQVQKNSQSSYGTPTPPAARGILKMTASGSSSYQNADIEPLAENASSHKPVALSTDEKRLWEAAKLVGPGHCSALFVDLIFVMGVACRTATDDVQGSFVGVRQHSPSGVAVKGQFPVSRKRLKTACIEWQVRKTGEETTCMMAVLRLV
jgi:hypothetical protein